MVVIRPQVAADYPAIGSLEGVPPEEVAAQATSNPQFTGLVAVRDGRVVGRASAGFMHQSTPVGDLRCLVTVDPAWRRQGVGAALWSALLEAVRVFRPVHLRANGNPGDPDSVAWARHRGFAVTQHLKFQRLDLEAAVEGAPAPEPAPEPAPAPAPAAAPAAGFRFVPFSELRTPDGERQLHAMYQEYLSHTPDAAESPYQPFEPWRSWAFDSEGAWPEGWLVAVAPDGRWAGFTLAQRSGERQAHIFMSGVAPDFRDVGLGTALKAAAIRHARRLGVNALTTLNHAANAPILAINRQLGFRVEEEILRLVRRCQWD